MRKETLKGTLFGFLIASLMGAGVAGYAHERGARGVVVDGEALEARVEAAMKDLAIIERLNDRSRDRKIKGRIHQEVHELRQELEGIDAMIDRADDVRHDDDLDGDHDGHRAEIMSDAEIDAIVAALDRAYSSKAKLQLIRDACNGRWIRTAQVIRLMEEMSFSVDRIEIAAMLHGNVADEAAFYKVYNHLPFESDRETLRQRLGQ